MIRLLEENESLKNNNSEKKSYNKELLSKFIEEAFVIGGSTQ